MATKNLALLLLKKRQLKEATELFEQYLQLNPDDPEYDQIRKIIETYGPSV